MRNGRNEKDGGNKRELSERVTSSPAILRL